MKANLALAFLLMCVLPFCTACGSGTNTPAANSEPANSTPNKPENTGPQPEGRDAYKAALDAFYAAFEKMDADAMVALFTERAQKRPDRFKKEMNELRDSVERIEFTRRTDFYEEAANRWESSYDMTLHKKTGKKDGEPNKKVWIVMQGGKWRIDMSCSEVSR